jgi:hypothetical protein
LWAHPLWPFLFQPTGAAYLKLIEPWWNVLPSLDLEGRRYDLGSDRTGRVGSNRLLEQHQHPLRYRVVRFSIGTALEGGKSFSLESYPATTGINLSAGTFRRLSRTEN